jgi:hypothetical protein
VTGARIPRAQSGYADGVAENGARLLGIYLNDHLAGSTTAVELLRRAVGQYEGTPLGEFLAGLRAEIQQDRETLKSIMAANGVEQQRFKLAAAWVAEKAGRLMLNGALLRRSPLTLFAELETLAIGIHGKELLWRALRELAPDEATAGRLDELIERARRQHEDVERHRRAVGARVIAPARVP